MEIKLNETIKTVLLGHELVSENIIVTPLESIYGKIMTKYEKHLCVYDSMYKNCIINSRIHVIKVPQGIQAQDLINVCENKNILFIGYAGGFEKVDIGEVVSIQTAVMPSGERCELLPIDNLKNVVCGYSPALIGDIAYEYQCKAKMLECNVVDMEISHFSFANKSNRISSMMLITDLPGQREFWELNREEAESIKFGKEKLMNLVYEYINRIIDTKQC